MKNRGTPKLSESGFRVTASDTLGGGLTAAGGPQENAAPAWHIDRADLAGDELHNFRLRRSREERSIRMTAAPLPSAGNLAPSKRIRGVARALFDDVPPRRASVRVLWYRRRYPASLRRKFN
jgi:hypothetical protein